MKIVLDPRKINSYSSIFLDTLRISAALLVVFSHTYDQLIYGYQGRPYNLINIGHPAVIVFFALSGYVIAYSTTSKNRGLKEYLQARFSKLCSIVIPALLITAVIQILVCYLDKELYTHLVRGLSWPRYILSGLFVNEIWFFSAAPLFNVPLWSLSFEFWYYIIYGLGFYKTKNINSYLFVILAVLIAGPKILLMMPIWLIGNLAYRVKAPDFSKNVAWTLIGIFFLIAIMLVVYLPLLPYHLGHYPLFFASQFITDWIIGLFVGLALWLLPRDAPSKVTQSIKAEEVKFRKIADLTFPLYVLHFPVLILWRAIFGVSGTITSVIIAVIANVLVCSLIGSFFESKRYWWVKLFDKILTTIRNLFKKPQYQKA